MALPKLASLQFKTKIPSTGADVLFRPFLVKEEKALLVAMESGDTELMLLSLREIVNNCLIDSDFDVGTAPYFDSEYLFLQMRAKSIGEISKLNYSHTDNQNYNGDFCDHVTELVINLEEVKAEESEGHHNEFQISSDPKMSVKMKYPSLADISNLNFEEEELSDEFSLVASCLDYAFDDKEIYEADTIEEKIEFVESMNNQQLTTISKFFDTMPRVRHTVTYTCAGCNQEDTIKLEGLSDFF